MLLAIDEVKKGRLEVEQINTGYMIQTKSFDS